MTQRTPRSTRTDKLLPYTTRYRSSVASAGEGASSASQASDRIIGKPFAWEMPKPAAAPPTRPVTLVTVPMVRAPSPQPLSRTAGEGLKQCASNSPSPPNRHTAPHSAAGGPGPCAHTHTTPAPQPPHPPPTHHPPQH